MSYFYEEVKDWHHWLTAVVAGVLVFTVTASVYGFFAYIRPAKISSSVRPGDLGVSAEEVILRTTDGVKISSWFVRAQVNTDKAIILLHGYPADAGDILTSTIFLSRRYNLLYVDFRYFGASQGRYTTIGIKETYDVLGAVKYLQDEGMTRIGVWGFSMGGAAALMSLPKTNAIDAVVSDSSYASLYILVQDMFNEVPVLNRVIAWLIRGIARTILQIDIKNESPLVALQKNIRPILIIHSSQDEVIPFKHAELLMDASYGNPDAEFWFPKGGGHGYIIQAEYMQRVGDFFQKYL